MYMIFYAINTVKLTVFIFYHARNVSIQFRAMRFRNCWQTMLGPEDDLIIDLAVRAHLVF